MRERAILDVDGGCVPAVINGTHPHRLTAVRPLAVWFSPYASGAGLSIGFPGRGAWPTVGVGPRQGNLMTGTEPTGANRFPTSLPDDLFDGETDLEIIEGELIPRRPRSRSWDPAVDTC